MASEITGLLQAIPRGSSSTGDKILAAAHLVRTLPELLHLSSNQQTLLEARELGSALDYQLAAAGIDSRSAFGQLPDRIDAIERDASIQEKRREVESELRRVSDQIEIPAIRQFLATIGQNLSNR